MENIKQTFINDLSSYFPVGRQVILFEEEVEPKTKAGISLGKQKKLKLVKSGSTIEEIELIPGSNYETYVVLADHTPILSLTDGNENYIQVDSAYIIGTERVYYDINSAISSTFDIEPVKLKTNE